MYYMSSAEGPKERADSTASPDEELGTRIGGQAGDTASFTPDHSRMSSLQIGAD